MRYQLKCAVWEFTLSCNLKCSHCGSSAGEARPNELDTQECFNLCEELATLGCDCVALMGGEPFLRKDWLSVAQCIKDLGMNLNFVSNGLILDRYINELSKLEPQVVGISIDGLENTHDKIRGVKGSFKKAIDSMELLRKNGIQITVITTVSKINFNELEQMKELIYKKGVNWQIQVAMPFGNFKREYMLSKEEFYAVAMFIAAQRIKTLFDDLPVVGAHCFGYYSKILPGCYHWEGCTAGISSIGITSDGGIVGCLSMGNDRFIEGNVRERRLEKIWFGENSFGYNRKFGKSMLGPNCRDCKYGTKCKGGCNSISYTVTNKFHNDPYCFYKIEKEIIV
ncbi:MAG: radical SAM protein [Candidatus Thermoplasmatota archaeon]